MGDGILEIHTLGGLKIQHGQRELLSFRTKKTAALLVYLACTGNTHPREVLAEMFWPERTLDASRSNLRAALTDLRHGVGSSAVITRETVSLPPGNDHWTDVTALECGLTYFQEHRPSSDSEKSVKGLLQETLALYTGDFLDGFYIDSPEFENWALMERERVRSRVMAALDVLINHHLLNGEYDRGLERGATLLQMDPLREKTIRQLMQLHAQSGDRITAINRYEAWQLNLYEELGLEPEPETVSLYEEIKSGKFISSLTHTLDTIQPVEIRLPHPNTPLIGREEEIQQVVSLVTDPDVQLVTILGPGGIGKTRLAIAVADHLLPSVQSGDCFPDGIFFASLEMASSTDDLLKNLCKAIGMQLDIAQLQLINYLSTKQMLVILDNFEDVGPAGSPLIGEIIDAAPHLCFLLTSREPVNLYGEHRFPVSGLAISAPGESSGVEDFPAIKLLVQSAKRLNPNFSLTADDFDSAITICRIVSGMPLAIELAAHWTGMLPMTEILDEIRRSLDFLETSQGGIADRHRSMRAVFETTWRRLTLEEQSAFTELTVFEGGFSRTAAQAVTGASLRLLASLVTRSLIQYDADEDRYSIHPLLRQFGAEKLAADPNREAATRDRHSDFFCATLHQLEPDVHHVSIHQDAVIHIDIEFSNIQRALNWAIEHGYAEHLWQAINTVGQSYFRLVRLGEAEALFGAIIEWLEAVQEPTIMQRCLMAYALNWCGAYKRYVRQPDDVVRQFLRRGNELCDHLLAGSLPDDLDQAVRNEKAYCLQQLSHVVPPDLAYDYLSQSLELFRETDDRAGEAFAIHAMGHTARRSNRLEEAEQWYTQSLTLFQQLGDGFFFQAAAGNLGVMLLAQGKLAQMQHLADHLWSTYQRPDDPVFTAMARMEVVDLLANLGQFSNCKALVEESLVTFRARKIRHRIPHALVVRHSVDLHRGDYRAVQTSIEDTYQFVYDLNNNLFIRRTLQLQAQLAMIQGDFEQARQFIQSTLDLPLYFASIYSLPGYIVDLALSALADFLLQQQETARQQVQKALAMSVDNYTYHGVLYSLSMLALMLADEGNLEQSIELYSVVMTQPFARESVWFDDIFGKRLRAEAVADLDTTQIEAAQDRGSRLDLWETAATLIDELDNHD